jgi:hypothetical protein
LLLNSLRKAATRHTSHERVGFGDLQNRSVWKGEGGMEMLGEHGVGMCWGWMKLEPNMPYAPGLT